MTGNGQNIFVRNLQRTHWYTLTGPTDAWPGGDSHPGHQGKLSQTFHFIIINNILQGPN